MKTLTQEQQVVERLRNEGGYATLKRLNEIIDFSTWKTKTPEASVRRIVQESKYFFKIQPGLWALEEFRNTILQKFELKIGDKYFIAIGFPFNFLLVFPFLSRFACVMM